MKLRIAGLARESVVDGPGIRFAVFTQGCRRNCPGCHNPTTHDLTGGELVDCATLAAEILRNLHLDGVTLTGGEPFLQAAACAALLGPIRQAGLHIIAYSGFTWEELCTQPDALPLLCQLDVLVDGPYRADLRSPELPFRGSRNQRVINLPFRDVVQLSTNHLRKL